MQFSRVICAVYVTTMAASFSASASERLSAFGPGEQTTYRISYLGMTAGTAQITVGTEMSYEGQDVWPIVGLAQSTGVGAIYPVKDKFVTYWHHPGQRTLGSDLFAEENHKRRRQRIQLKGATATVIKQKAGEDEETRTHDVHPATTDMGAVTFALRNLPLHSGAEHEIPVFTGARSFVLKAKVEGVETLKTLFGDREAFRLRVYTQFSGKLAARRDMWFYYSTDDARLPLRIEAELALGRIVAELTDYKPGRRLAMVEKKSNVTGG